MLRLYAGIVCLLVWECKNCVLALQLLRFTFLCRFIDQEKEVYLKAD